MKKEVKDIVEILDAYEEIKKAYDAIKPRALELLNQGEEIPGYFLKSTGSTVAWAKGSTAKKVFTSLKKWIAKESDIIALVSPATVKKYIKESPEALAKFDKLVDKKPKAPSLSKDKG